MVSFTDMLTSTQTRLNFLRANCHPCYRNIITRYRPVPSHTFTCQVKKCVITVMAAKLNRPLQETVL